MATHSERFSYFGSALVVSVLAGIGASICCLGPFLLLLLGISGAWIAHLAAFERFRPACMVLALVLVSVAGYRLYLAAEGTPQSACACSPVRRRQRFLFWIVAPLVLILVVTPWILPLLYR